MMLSLKTTATIGVALLAAACSKAPYEPIVDGPRDAKYASDLAACRQLSEQKQSDNTGTIAGAVIGGLAGADEDVEGAVVGATVGGLIGSASDKADTRDARDVIVYNCMRGRGHNVVG